MTSVGLRSETFGWRRPTITGMIVGVKPLRVLTAVGISTKLCISGCLGFVNAITCISESSESSRDVRCTASMHVVSTRDRRTERRAPRRGKHTWTGIGFAFSMGYCILVTPYCMGVSGLESANGWTFLQSQGCNGVSHTEFNVTISQHVTK